MPSPYSSGWRDLKNTADRMFAIDHDQTGKLDHLCFIAPAAVNLPFSRNAYMAIRSKGSGVQR